MKKGEIEIGGLYRAKVSGKLTTVKVLAIRERSDWKGRTTTAFDVVNTATGRKTAFKSATKFRGREAALEAGLADAREGRLVDGPVIN